MLFVFKMVFDTLVYKLKFHIPMVSFYVNPAYRSIDFLLGYLFYLLINAEGMNISKLRISLIQMIFLILLPFCWIKFDRIWTPTNFILISLIFIYLNTIKGSICDFILGNKLFVYLGDISFELFILHSVALKVTKKINSLLDNLLVNENYWIVAFLLNIFLAVVVVKIFGRFKNKTFLNLWI